MARIRLGLAALLLVPFLCLSQSTSNVTEWPLHDNGLNRVVQWDHYSFKINGERLFVWSGEFHYWRIPVPELWEDVLEKIKAAGFNTVSIYALWSYHHSNPYTLDFETGAHNFRSALELCKKTGLYVIFRPGPYVNAEANAGGYPLWITTGAYGTLRNNDTRYTNAWRPFFDEVSSIVSEYQVTRGGTVITYQIENELGTQWVGDPRDRVLDAPIADYMEKLEAAARKNGIDVPTQANAPNLNAKSWSEDFASGTLGNVDIYGVDSYPSCWTCNLTECLGTNGAYQPYKTFDYAANFEEVSPTQPSYLPEFQGGSFNPWGGPRGGCPKNTGPDFANLYYRDNAAQRVTAMSLYMLYGGTNWGGLAAPVVATSYDYSSPISEGRGLTTKYAETKLVGMFFRSARDLTVTESIANGTNYTTNPMISVTELRNPHTGAGFYFTIHDNSTITTREVFKLMVNTSIGALTIPRHAPSIVLDGPQSKIVVTDFKFGSTHVLYSTAEVLSTSTVGRHDTLVLWVPTGEAVEFSIKGAKQGIMTRCAGCASYDFIQGREQLTVVIPSKERGMAVAIIDQDLTVIVADRSYAYSMWAPTLSADLLVKDNDTGTGTNGRSTDIFANKTR